MKRSLSILSLLILYLVLYAADIGGATLNSNVPPIKPANVDTERVGQIVDFVSALQEKDDIEAARLLMKVLHNDASGELPLVMLFQKLKNPEVAKVCRPELQRLANENPSALKLNLAALILTSDADSKARTRMALAALDTVNNFDDLDEQTLLAAIRIVAITGQLLAVQNQFEEGDRLFQRVALNNKFRNNFEFVESAALFYRTMEVTDTVSLEQRKNATVRKNAFLGTILEKFNQPNDANDAHALAGIYERLGEYDLAISTVRNQLVKMADDQTLWGLLGMLYTRVGRNQEALEIRRSLALQFPDNLWIQLQYAESLVFTSMNAAAIPILEKILALQPQDQYSKMLLGVSYYETGNYQQAIKHLDGIDNFNALRLQIGALNYLREYDHAIELLEKSASQYADNIGLPYYFMFLEIGEKSGNVELAKKYAEVIKSKFGWKDPQIANAIGYTYATLNIELELAEELITRALKASPNNVEIMDSMAWLLYQKKDFKNARVYIDQALSNSSEQINSVIAEHAGDIYWQLRQYQRAAKYWKKALTSSDGNINREDVRKKLRAANELVVFED